MHRQQVLKECLELLKRQALIDIDKVLVQNLHCVIVDVLDALCIDGRSSVDHYFKLKTGWVPLFHAQIFKKAEHKA